MDVILCETFPHVGEALVAVEEAVATGVPTWLALTAGPAADLLSPEQLADGARRAIERGASAVLVNCVPAARSLPFVAALAELGAPFGVYANAGEPADGIGWGAEEGPSRYLGFAAQWIAAGATIVGGCCGTGPRHIALLAQRFAGFSPSRDDPTWLR